MARTARTPRRPVESATAAGDTPIAVRTALDLTPRFEDSLRERLGGLVAHAAPVVERATVRFEDVNGPKGGLDTVCRIKLVLARRPSIVVAEQAADPEIAFGRALRGVQTALERERTKHGLSTGARRRGRGRPRAVAPARPRAPDPGELIGRRVGRGPKALARALARPEKRRRDAYVDTAEPGVAAHHRRAGGGATARRNTLRHAPRAIATLEDSRTRPSRKSTRRSANRAKAAQAGDRLRLHQPALPSARAARRR